MIELSEKEFEKISGPIGRVVRKIYDNGGVVRKVYDNGEMVLIDRAKTKAKGEVTKTIVGDKENPRERNRERVKKLKNGMTNTNSRLEENSMFNTNSSLGTRPITKPITRPITRPI